MGIHEKRDGVAVVAAAAAARFYLYASLRESLKDLEMYNDGITSIPITKEWHTATKKITDTARESERSKACKRFRLPWMAGRK